uniref:WD repeat-containing protein 59 n=1 Tax=Romanomermis culicivorax TaxID=13658 RepID=A0A915J298_ROMCU
MECNRQNAAWFGAYRRSFSAKLHYTFRPKGDRQAERSKLLAIRSVPLDTKDPASVCAQNALMLNQKGRKDLAKLWRLLDKCAERSFAKINSQFDSPWPLTPFGRKLIDQLINHYRDCGDFQTAALICCTFGSKVKMRPKSQAFGRKLSKAFGQRPLEQSSDSVYNTIHGTYGNHIRENLSAQRHRSNSFTEEAEVTSNNCNLNDDPLLTPISENGNNGHSKTASKEDSVIISPLDPTCTNKYEGIRLAYADLLHRWNFLNQRAQIMQYSRVSIERHDGVEYRMLCRTCNTECLSSSYCHSCRSSVGFSCVICKIAVKGLASICALCLHGGHTKHMLSWFQEHNKCPSGCGCTCSYA